MRESNHSDEELNSMEQEAFCKLRDELDLPEHLQDKIVTHLKQLHLIQTSMKTKTFYWAAAVVAALIAGYLFGSTNFNTTPKTMSEMKEQFMLLLYEDESFNGENISALVEEYSNWAKAMHAKGQLTYAEKLKDEKFDFGNMQDDFSSSITGYFVIKANNLDEAMRIAKAHPHLKYNGGVELRQIDKLN